MLTATTFFTSSRVPKVDLDLVDLAGGGVAPTQFDGTTRDGRHVYVRYRGGGLTIDVAKEPGGDALVGDCILDVQLGPIHDGAISISQYLKLTGLSVDHPLPDDGWEDEPDLSGATTFWRSAGLPTTEAGAHEVMAAVFAASTDVAEVVTQDGRETRRPLAAGAIPTERLVEGTLSSGGAQVQLSYSGFKFAFPGYGVDDIDEKHSEEIGVDVTTVGSRSSELKYQSLLLSADFPTTDEVSREALARLGRTIDTIYPSVRYGKFDPVTGERLDDETVTHKEDHHIGDWIAAEPRRFRKLVEVLATGKYYGLRPV